MEVNKFSEMIYQNKLKHPICLSSGVYNGYYFWIVSYGSHPCAYVAVPSTHILYNHCNYEDFDKLNVHGGITYCTYGLHNIAPKNMFIIGWDYNHCTDFNSVYNYYEGNKKWTVKEMLDNTFNVINQLIAIQVNTNE